MLSQSLERPLDAAVAPLGSLGLYSGRSFGPPVGRPRELAVLANALAAAQQRMACVVLEGEPGIGKTRLLLAVEEQARSAGFVPIAVTADEEIRGPFLLARSIFGSPALLAASDDVEVVEALSRATDALSGQDDRGLESMAPDRRLVRTFDLASSALRALAAKRPIALLLDDLQWADEDSLRMLRYLVRTDAASPMLMVLATRPDETAFVHEAVTLLADLDRVGILHRLRLSRFSQLESTELLQQVLGGQINLSTAAVMHAQSEGVPFVLVEQAHAYKEAGLIQQIDGQWTLARNAQRLLPSAVRTLIDRRAARLPEETRDLMAEAAVLGRSFSLRDLTDVRRHLGEVELDADEVVERLAPGVSIGLLIQHPDGATADYTFSHEGVREYCAATLPAPRRRSIHGAVTSMLTAGTEGRPECLVLLAQHALAAGQTELSVRVSIDAARGALASNAPDEALRLVEQAQRVASGAQDRIALLCLQDDALGMLRRPWQRQEGLTELAALAEALGDVELELDIMLRRAAAHRLSEEHDAAAVLAGQVRSRAAELRYQALELAAALELGQDLLRSELGEGYAQAPSEADLDGAGEAFGRAVELAQQLGDERALAAATRELGVIETSHVRIWFVEAIKRGEHLELLARVAAGEQTSDILPTLPVAPHAYAAMGHFRAALDIYERLGDRQGTMSTIIAMSITSWAADIHLTGSTRHIEEIRRLSTRLKSMTRESERARADAQMVFGTHVYARIRLIVDAAIEKGQEAYTAARALGERGLEFAAACGVAREYALIGAVDEAERWLERAAAVASTAPTPVRARQLESARGLAHWAEGDRDGMLSHLQQAVAMGFDQGHPADRCEALAQLACCAAWLGSEQQDESLLDIAANASRDVITQAQVLPGHPPWRAQANAVLAHIALHRGDPAAAVDLARAALVEIDEAVHEELVMDVELLAGRVLLEAGSADEQAGARDRARLILSVILQRIADEEIRARWFRARYGRALTELAGPATASPVAAAAPGAPEALLDAPELDLIRLVAEGYTNAEIAKELAISEEQVAQQLATVFAKLGAVTRADATTAALIGRLV
jgi:DNA-binding CsgD family transcriptional regulator